MLILCALSYILKMAPNKMVEDARTVLGNQFVGLRTQLLRMHERKSIHGAPNKTR